MGREPFGEVLRRLREQAGLSGHALARRVSVDPSYVNRLERGQREAPRESMVAAIAAALALDAAAADRLFLGAGYLPPSLAALGTDDGTLLELARVLTSAEVPPEARDDLRQVLALLLRHWQALRATQ